MFNESDVGKRVRVTQLNSNRVAGEVVYVNEGERTVGLDTGDGTTRIEFDRISTVSWMDRPDP